VSHLIDTNILSRVIVVKDALSPVAEAAIDALQGRGEHLVVAPQNLMEFWAVCASPKSHPRSSRGLAPVVTVVKATDSGHRRYLRVRR
jgi:predicted nucleic acid-binding protein